MKAAQVKDVTISFGDFTAVDMVSLNIEQGAIYGLLGPNGAGKTTIFRAMATLLQPTSGTIEIFGTDVVKEPSRVRSSIGLAGQYAAVDEALTGMQNLEMAGQVPAQDILLRLLICLQLQWGRMLSSVSGWDLIPVFPPQDGILIM